MCTRAAATLRWGLEGGHPKIQDGAHSTWLSWHFLIGWATREPRQVYRTLAHMARQDVLRSSTAKYLPTSPDLVADSFESTADVLRLVTRSSPPPLFSLVGVLWRTKQNTIDGILIQWHANKWQGILQLSRYFSQFLYSHSLTNLCLPICGNI